MQLSNGKSNINYDDGDNDNHTLCKPENRGSPCVVQCCHSSINSVGEDLDDLEDLDHDDDEDDEDD